MKIVDEHGTRDRILRLIHDGTATSVADLAAHLGLSAAGIRRHLDQLLDEGAVSARSVKAVGRGRPARVFALTDEGRHRFEQRYDQLAADALRFLAETGGDDAVRAFAQRRVAFIERDYAAVAEEHPDLSPAQVLARVLSDEGYAAGVRHLPIVGNAGAEQLCQQHCPVSHVAHEFPQLCEAETEAIARVLGSHVQRLATIAHGDAVCTTCIPTPSATQRKASR